MGKYPPEASSRKEKVLLLSKDFLGVHTTETSHILNFKAILC